MKKMLLALVTFLSFSISAFAAVNLNTATQAELESLKNIGPVKAQAIIDYRKKSGGFKTVEDLNNVPGIGDKTMESLKGEIAVSGVTKVTTPVAKDTKPAKDAKPVKEMKAAKPADVVAPTAKPVTADKAAVDVKPADTAKADKKAAADAKKAAKQAAADEKKAAKQAAADKKSADKKAAADAKKAAKADVAPAATATKAK